MRALILILVLASASAHAETKIYTVQGMHCGACVAAVKSKVCKIPGVDSCVVEMNKVTLTGPQLDDGAVNKAVDRAGYAVAKVDSSIGPVSTSPAPTEAEKKATK